MDLDHTKTETGPSETGTVRSTSFQPIHVGLELAFGLRFAQYPINSSDERWNQLPGDKNPLSKGIVVDHLMTEPPAPIDALKSFGSRFMVSPQTSQPFHDPAFTSYPNTLVMNDSPVQGSFVARRSIVPHQVQRLSVAEIPTPCAFTIDLGRGTT
ncbi:MAG TPA: hypothetical protein VN442_08615 [Bryobacteraceae bacterium]|nr:hypothetical protein [Bryobacteraceae bacterium]